MLGLQTFKCGCWIGEIIGEGGKVVQYTGIGHCPEHAHLFSQDKTVREMAQEIQGIFNEGFWTRMEEKGYKRPGNE